MNNIYNSRLLELIEYARQTALMSDTPKLQTEDYKIFIEYERSIRDLPGVQLNQSSADSEDEIWLSVARLREIPAPAIQSKLLESWIEVSNDPDSIPRLKTSTARQTLEKAGVKLISETAEPVKPTSLIALENFQLKDRVESEFKDYINQSWKPWSESEKPRRKTITLYGKLFALKQQLEGGITDTQTELVWGIGSRLENERLPGALPANYKRHRVITKRENNGD